MFFVPPDLNATISELSAMRLFRETPCAAAPSLPTSQARSLALFYGFSMVSIRSPCPSARISMKALRSSARTIARCRSGLSNGGLSRFDDQIDAGIGWRCSTARPCAYASTALYRPAESGRSVSKCQSCNLQQMRSRQWRQSPLRWLRPTSHRARQLSVEHGRKLRQSSRGGRVR